jgi:hypothetical protein
MYDFRKELSISEDLLRLMNFSNLDVSELYGCELFSRINIFSEVDGTAVPALTTAYENEVTRVNNGNIANRSRFDLEQSRAYIKADKTSNDNPAKDN